MTQAALVNPIILTWSRERAGLSAEQVAKKLPVKPESVKKWEAGEAKPTFLQAQKWANVAHVPFGFLFLPKPPAPDALLVQVLSFLLSYAVGGFDGACERHNAVKEVTALDAFRNSFNLHLRQRLTLWWLGVEGR